MNIVVLCGGLYPERDVSISSGRQIATALMQNGHKVLLMDLFFGYPAAYTNAKEVFDNDFDRVVGNLQGKAPDLLKIKAQRPGDDTGEIGPNVFALCKAADIVFMALHGENGENGRLQAAFDLAGIRYTGSGYLGSALAMHKGISRTLVESVGISVPKGFVVKQGETPQNPSFPVVVKPCSGGSSVATTIVYTQEEYRAAIDAVFALGGDEALVEQFIQGREFSVGVLGDVVLPVIEICPKEGFYDYETKYQKGFAEEVCPAEIPVEIAEKMQDWAQKAHKALHLEVYSRADFMLREDGAIFYLESNTLPGMTPLSLLPQEAAAIGLDFGALCEKIMELSMEKYR